MPFRHRQNVLFLGAVLLPSVLLIALGFRMIRQEDELERRRLGEQHRQSIALIRQELLTRLEAIKLRAANEAVAHGDPDIALVARLVSGKVILPWEVRPSNAEPYLGQLQNPKKSEALLRTSASVADEYGVPVAVYAARSLIAGATPVLRGEILDRVSVILQSAALSPTAAHMVAEISGRGPMHDAATARAEEGEMAEQLARHPPSFDSDPGRGPVWRLFGSAPWLAGVTGRPSDAVRILVAVRARNVLASVRLPETGRWDWEDRMDGESLGDGLPGLRVRLPLSDEPGRHGNRQLFYLTGLTLLILVILFTGYLLHRDVRRETHLAAVRSQFVSSVSHELRTPIATIRAFAELIVMGRVSSEQERDEYMKGILGESERLSRLVDGVLEFSRIEQGKRSYRLRPVALAEVLQTAAQAFAYPLAQGNFELKISVERDLPPVTADREALEQAVMNLLGNAIRYSGDARLIEVAASRESGHAVIRVRDYGIGIANAEQPRIFERFYRAEHPEGRQIAGTGLGLALVEHVVIAHGGSVAVQSQPGQGSTFSILLPLSLPL